MKYFIDTEFIENGFLSPLELISIGIVSEDGREYYAVSSEFNPEHANQWVTENVLPHLPDRKVGIHEIGFPRWEAMKAWSQLDAISYRVRELVGNDPSPEFWGWCCGFDYVLFSQLIGFNDWPNGWPYYFRDLQQLADESGIPLTGESRNDTHNALADAKEIKALYERLTA